MVDCATGENWIDLEMRIFQRRDEGYPVGITLGGQQEFPHGYLSADVLPWVPTIDPVDDGQRLFDALFADRVLHDAWIEARGRSAQRRIRLRIDPEAPELHALPWELLREGGTMLPADASTPFSRYLPVVKDWGKAVKERPIHVLVAISNPSDLQSYNLASLDVELERSNLKTAFFALDKNQIQLDFLDAPVTLERLAIKLQEGYHVLHYLGHGTFSKREQCATLFMQDEKGETMPVNDECFIGTLSSLRVRPRLVFLAACQSATHSSANAFLGLAPKLVEAGVPAVVAMQDKVAVETARKLSLTFYRRLAEHGVVDCAMNEARSVLLSAGRPDAAVPVLFMRLKSGQLWRGRKRQSPRRKRQSPRLKHLRKCLMESFADTGEVRDFCEDHLGEEMTFILPEHVGIIDLVRKIIAYCRAHGQLDILYDFLAEERPRKYASYHQNYGEEFDHKNRLR